MPLLYGFGRRPGKYSTGQAQAIDPLGQKTI
jgi:hypothetical protein